MIKAVIFDMDGLMIDSEEISFLCYQEVLKKENIELTKEFYTNFLGKTIESAFEIVEKAYDVELDIDQHLHHFRSTMERHVSSKGVPIKKGLIELLTYLKENNYLTIIATSSGKPRVDQLLKDTNVLSYFDAIVYGDEVEHGKPCPDIFLKACMKLNVSPTEALVLEDSEAGIQAASHAGIPVICIPDMKYPDPIYQDMTTDILDSLDQVINFLETE